MVEVAIPLPVDATYDYLLPDGIEVAPGCRVIVPYRGRKLAAFVLRVSRAPNSAAPAELRSVVGAVDPEPVLGPELLEAVLHAARESLCPPGIALRAAIPPGTEPRSGRRLELLDPGRRALERGEARGSFGRILSAIGRGPVREEALGARFPAALPLLDRLEQLGWISRTETTDPPRVRPRTERVFRIREGLDLDEALATLGRAPRQRAILEALADAPSPLSASSALAALCERGLVVGELREVRRTEVPPALGPDPGIPELTPHQREATGRIRAAIASREGREFLLYGITGSGKTEVYLRATAAALEAGRTAIVLVPEISLTHQLVDRFRARFPDRVAVLHSGLSAGDRFDQWRAIHAGEFPIAIGARSAVFAPVKNLGLLVIDEEHDAAYKNTETRFRYHAREVAQFRSRAANCPLVLGSATPDIETSYRSTRGEIERLNLPYRIARRPLPEVEIVDMQREPRQRGRPTILSRALRTSLSQALAADQQAILFLNRRGFATLAYCYACGHGMRCKHCEISLVYHTTGGPHRPERPEQGVLRCHYCGFQVEPSSRCEACGSPEGTLFGFGTERVEEEVTAMFPRARVARLDGDTSAAKGAQRRILGDFHARETDVLIGTQMVAKGHDVPGVTLVGVIAADLGLQFPDFRAAERTFQLLTQVAGRAGRGDEAGRVVIQTCLPDQYAIALARTHDYPSFFREELRHRKPHGYPPFRALAQLLLAGKREHEVESAARDLAQLARSPRRAGPDADPVEVLGPAPAPIARLRDRFRWQILLLGPRSPTHEVARELSEHAQGRFRGVVTRVDLSPLSML